jgi:DNA-binding transcriptional MocR family regulator
MIVTDTIQSLVRFDAGKPKYQAIADALSEAVSSGRIAPGTKVPPVRDLAYHLSVTPGTVARAYSILAGQAVLTAGVGRGTFVAETRKRAVTVSMPVLTDPPPTGAAEAHLLSPKPADMGQTKVIRAAMHRLADRMSTVDLLAYPTEFTAEAARNSFLAQQDVVRTGPFSLDDVVVAHGGQAAVVMILQTVLTGPKPVIAMDALGYAGFRTAALLCRAEVVGIPWDDEGPEPAALVEAIRLHGVQVFCTAAEVNNPTTRTTTPTRRAQIAEIAERHQIHVIDDECYALRRPNGPGYRALLPGLGWLVASPSKGLSSALRIGFAVAPEGWSRALARTATYQSFGVSRFITDLYTEVMSDADVPGIIEAVADRATGDVRACVNVLGGHRVAYASDVPFLWLELPVGWRAGEFCVAARDCGVLVKPAEDFALRDSRHVHAARIAMNGRLPREALVTAMERLRDLLEAPPGRMMA